MTDSLIDEHRIPDLHSRQQKALAMGGEQRIERQHQRGRLTARERIDLLLDPDTFDEQGLLAHSDRPEVKAETPADGKICGFGEIEQRTVFVSADDATVMAGAGGRVGVRKQFEGMSYAAKKGYPCIHLGDGGGARIPDIMGATGMMSMVYPINGEPRNRRVPLITAIMGDCYGGPSWTAAVSDIVIQVKGSYMAVAGPPVLEASTGAKVSPEALGGWELHAHKTGQVDIVVENEAECFQKIRDVLTYLPSHAGQLPPVADFHPSMAAPPDATLEAVPSNPRRIYDMHQLLECLFDAGSVLELKPDYDGSLITCFARLEGHVVGVLANNPQVMVGAMGPGACEKATAFICLCDSYHIPLVFLHDTPGFFVSQTAEEQKMPLKIMTFLQALQLSSVPRLSVIVRKSYGMAHCNMVGGNMGADLLLAWTLAEVSFMAPAVAVNVMFGRRLEDMDDPEAAKQMFIEQMQQDNAIWEAAGLNLVHKVIDPRDTRRELIKGLRRAQGSDGQRGMSKRQLANWARMF